VLAERRRPGGGAQYLVAWQQLPLEQASWEEAAVRGGGVCRGAELERGHAALLQHASGVAVCRAAVGATWLHVTQNKLDC
jgi:hypothetical protein